MNKKLNTLLFVLGATVFNIIVTVIAFFIMFILYARFLAPVFPQANQWAFSVIFIASIVISFVVYRVVLKFLFKKIDVEKYFDPLFVSKYRKPKPPQA